MSKTSKKSLFIPFIAVVVFCNSVNAEMSPPSIIRFFSGNNSYCMKIVPYIPIYEREQERKNLAEANKCYAIFYKRLSDSTYSEVWTKPLINMYTPMGIYIFNNGRYFITFDDYPVYGYGDKVIAFYDSTGTLMWNSSLEKLIPDKYLSKLGKFEEGRFWRDTTIVDEEEMTLSIVSNLIYQRLFNSKVVKDTFKIDLLRERLIKK
jgi:hypothetical protein